jgi:hypothetical protein
MTDCGEYITPEDEEDEEFDLCVCVCVCVFVKRYIWGSKSADHINPFKAT